MLLQLDRGTLDDDLDDDYRKLIETTVSGYHSVNEFFTCMGRMPSELLWHTYKFEFTGRVALP